MWPDDTIDSFKRIYTEGSTSTFEHHLSNQLSNTTTNPTSPTRTTPNLLSTNTNTTYLNMFAHIAAIAFLLPALVSAVAIPDPQGAPGMGSNPWGVSCPQGCRTQASWAAQYPAKHVVAGKSMVYDAN